MRDFTFPIPEFRKSKFRPWMLGLLFLGAAILVACPTDCNENAITGPTVPIPPDPEPEPEPDPEPIFNPGSMLDLRTTEIFSGFALNSRDEQTQRIFLRSAQRRGYETVRMCVELRRWNEYAAFNHRGPYLWGQEALDAYENTLRVIADEGMAALVMTVCSDLRWRGTNEDRLKWVRDIGKRTRGYTNVAFEINEAWHPNSMFRNDNAHIKDMIAAARVSSGGLMSGADQNLGARGVNYHYDNRWRSDYFSFHPWRSKPGGGVDFPSEADVRDIVKVNGGWVVFSETIAYTSNPAKAESWLYTTDKNVLRGAMRACRPKKGCTWTFHSERGLFADEAFDWMPQEF